MSAELLRVACVTLLDMEVLVRCRFPCHRPRIFRQPGRALETILMIMRTQPQILCGLTNVKM